ncbi:MAG: hypothetical protein ACXWV9_08210 [Flavisolibacter sp.]
MKKNLPLCIIAIFAIFFSSSCARKAYTSSFFDQQTATHRTIAVLPAEMIFTGTKPKNVTDEEIDKIEEAESVLFQNSLYNGILRHANSGKYFIRVLIQDISTTQKLLEENNITVRNSWKENDKKLATILGVDAVVRMRVQKKRYMSDLASMGVNLGQNVLNRIGPGNLPFPSVSSKTNDIIASCNVVSNNNTLWGDSYEGTSNYNRPSEDVVNDITDNFGKNFPYKQRK